MDVRRVTDRLSALATPSRLEVLRILARAGEAGMPSGEIAKSLNVPQNTLSTQLSVLAGVDLVEYRREGRFIIYRINSGVLAELLQFFKEELGAPPAQARARRRAAST